MLKTTLTFRLLVTVAFLVPVCAFASGETDLGKATEMSCDQLLHDTTTLFGTLIEIEYAMSFALEERTSLSARAKLSESRESMYDLRRANYLKIYRLIAMHHLFQEPTCPISKYWYRYRPTSVGKNSLWG